MFRTKQRHKRKSDYRIEDDGVTHVNIYSNSKCELGRMLSNFFPAPFNHPKYGFFTNVEGFWHFVATGFKHKFLKTVAGFRAKQASRGLMKVHNDNFHKLIKEAIVLKLEAHPEIKDGLLNNELPLDHYYVMNKNDTLIQFRPNGADELIDMYAEIKQQYLDKAANAKTK